MSRTPRRSLLRALESLHEFFDVVERFPDARAEMEAAVGAAGLEALARARADLADAVARLRGPPSGPAPGTEPAGAGEG